MLLFVANLCSAQVTFVNKQQAQEFKNTAETIVVLATESDKTVKLLSKKSDTEAVTAYRKMVADYNANLKSAFASDWSFNTPKFMTRSELQNYKKTVPDAGKVFVIAFGQLDALLADAGKLFKKFNTPEAVINQFLVSDDRAGSIDIMALSHWDAYMSSADEWEMKTQKQMELDKKMGNNTQPGDYLKHRQIPFVGFYLTQHPIPSPSDLRFGLFYLAADLKKAALLGIKAEVNRTVQMSAAHLIDKILLVGTDVVNFPSGKRSVPDNEIAKNYPYQYKIVPNSEIERAIAEKDSRYAVVIPAVRWQSSGYPELLLFYVVDAADGHSVISYADTGSGSNANTANQFERSQEMKAKHFREIVEHAEK